MESGEWSSAEKIFNEAREERTKGINILKEIGNKKWLVAALDVGKDLVDCAAALHEPWEKNLKRREWSDAEKIFKEARDQWTEGIIIFKEIGDKKWLAVALGGLGEIKLDRAVALQKRGEQKLKRLECSDAEMILQQEIIEWSGAEKLFQEVVQILQVDFPHYRLDLACAMRSLGKALGGLGNFDKSVECYETADRIDSELVFRK